MKKETTLEEVLGSTMCQFSVVENKLAILYRNQVKIYDALTKEQQSYSEEDVKQFAFECVANFLSNDDNKVEIKLVDVIIDRLNNKFEQFKKK